MAKRRTSMSKTTASQTGAAHSLTFDRVEADGAGQNRAVLVGDDGRTVVVPRDLLPAEAVPGATLTLTLAVDAQATATNQRNTAQIRADLKKTDPGGTIHL